MTKIPDSKPLKIFAKTNTTIKRRDFLKQVSAGSVLLSTLGLAGCGGGSGSNETNSAAPKNVVVLGAGAAGLTAALALKKQGHKVTILEYQNRIGGRLWSKQLLGGQCTELGAGHFSSSMPLVVSLINRYDLPIFSVNDGNPRYLMNNVEANADDVYWPSAWGLNSSEQLATVATTLIAYLVEAGIELETILHPNWPTEAAIAQFGDKTIRQLLVEQGASDGFISLLNVHLGAPVAEGDVLSGLPNLAYFFNNKGFFRVQGGNERIASSMADEFGRDAIMLNAPVVAIDQTGAQIKITTRDRTTQVERVYFADRVVSTIPFKVISEINMQPAWSTGKTRLFTEMVWFDGFKGVIQTQTPTWIAQGNYGWPMAATDQAWNRLIDITGNQTGGYSNAFFYVYTEPKLAQLKAITGANKITARTELVLNQFNTTLNGASNSSTPGFTNNLIDLNQVVTKDSIMWADGEDVPWIKAALAGSTKPWMRTEWSIPEGNIHFAGDFTSYKSGWVEGALESGLRAAAEIDPKANSL